MKGTKISAAPVRTVGSALPARPLISVAPSDSVLHAAQQMAEANCGSALVLVGGIIVGIVTERDMLIKVVATAADSAATAVEAIMTRKPVCARHDMPVTHALYTMKELGFRHFPVIDAGRKPLGIFSIRDALGKELASAAKLVERLKKITNSSA